MDYVIFQIRRLAIKALPSLCYDTKDHLTKIADVLTQLLPTGTVFLKYAHFEIKLLGIVFLFFSVGVLRLELRHYFLQCTIFAIKKH